jgi:hypothetical protein
MKIMFQIVHLTYDVIPVIIMHLVDVRVYQWPQAISITLNTKLSASTQSCGWKQNEFRECQDAVAFSDAGSSLCFAYFPGNNLRRIEKIDLAVW